MDEPKIDREAIRPVKYQLDIPKSSEPDHQMLALITLGTCFFIGVLGAFLFDGYAWGINIVLFSLVLITTLLLLRKLGKKSLTIIEYFLGASALFFSMTFAWHDSLVLTGLSVLGLFLTLMLAFIQETRQKVLDLEAFEVFEDLYLFAQYNVTSYRELITQDIQWKTLHKNWEVYEHALLKGLMITVPLILLFGFLLMTSDARFEDMINHLFDWGWNEEVVMRSILAFVLCSWIAIAILRAGVLNQGFSVTHKENPIAPASWKLGGIEIVMILGTLNLLFLSFIIVQFTYFFGGDVLVQSIQGPTYADYARRGFFQLVTVAVLVITLLLLTHWLHQGSGQWEKRAYQLLATVMIVMTMVIEVSAAHRMYLYTHEYGLTELRFYTSVFMLWLMILFIWFVITVLHERRSRFTFGALLSGMIFLGLLHIVNPDARIADINLARWQAEQSFDAAYLTSLSADVIPPLVRLFPDLSESQQCQLWQYLQFHPVLETSTDWRNFNLARLFAQDLLSSVSFPNCQ